MFQYIFIFIDGFELLCKVVVGVFDFVKMLGVCLMVYICFEEYLYILFFEIVVEMFQVFKECVEVQVCVVFKDVEDVVCSVGINCDIDMSCFVVFYMGIIDVVECYGCDVIFMVFYGWCGLVGLLFGSEMQKVFMYIEILVIVYC